MRIFLGHLLKRIARLHQIPVLQRQETALQQLCLRIGRQPK
jgi:hypothetical protein